VEDTPGTAKARARRVRVRKRAAEHEPAVEPDQLPGFEPVVVTEDDVPAEPEPEQQPERASVEPELEVEPEPETEPEPEPEPVVDAEAAAVPARSVPAQFGDDGDDVEVDDAALSTILDARTPLLQRAFRNAKPEPEPEPEPEPDADPEN
jgi:pilus assembly protein FimV